MLTEFLIQQILTLSYEIEASWDAYLILNTEALKMEVVEYFMADGKNR